MIDKNKWYEGTDLVLIEDTNNISAFTGRRNILVLDLQNKIMRIVTQQEQRQFNNIPILAAITQDLEMLIQNIQVDIHLKTPEETLQIRLHQLALAKILVFTHGKSDFILVSAHFAIGKAYLQNNFFEQAVNHLTIASTKVSKMGDIKETKVYNSYILTALARCYLALEGHHHALDLLLRAYDIQTNNQNIKGSSLAQETLQLLVITHIKLKSEKQGVKVLEKLIDIIQTQFVDFENLHTRLKQILDKENNSIDLKHLKKILEALAQKLQFLIVEYDRRPLTQILADILQETDGQWKNTSVFTQILAQLHKIAFKLIKQLKKHRIHKFKVYLQGEGENLTNKADQQLKNFIKQYEQQPDHPMKQLNKAQRLEVYKLLVHFCVRFSDHEMQLLYLNRIHDMLLQYVAENELTNLNTYKLQMLKVKRNMAMIYNQARMGVKAVKILNQIMVLQKQIYGKNSAAVKKTIKILHIIEGEAKFEKIDKKQRRTTVLRYDVQGKQSIKKLIL